MHPKFLARNQTLGQALHDIAAAHPQREALVLGEQRITLRQLDERVLALATGLAGLGIGRGDKVGLLLGNCPEYVYAVFAVAELGAAAVPINTQSRLRELEFILTDADAVAVISDVKAPGNDLLALLAELRPALPKLRHVIVNTRPDVAPAEGHISFARLLADGQARRAAGETATTTVEPADVAMLLYTSGTTGTPKGAMHSHRSLMMASRLIVAKYGLELRPSVEMIRTMPRYLKTLRRLPFLIEALFTRLDWSQLRLLVLTPFYHIAGYFQVILGTLAGDKLIVMERFHPEKALELIQKEHITLVVGVPPMYQAMLSRPDFEKFDVSSVIISLTTAMPTPPQLVKELRQRVGGFVVILYGATEIAATTLTIPRDDYEKQETTVGRADFEGVQVKIVDDQRNEVSRGTPGEIAVLAPSMMEGYYKRPEATAAAVDAAGWYYTGDVGTMDSQGYVQVLGRRGDMIIRAGANIYPAEIEHFLLTHPQIAQVAVIGVPSPAAGGEKVRAYVVAKPGATLTQPDVLGYCWGQIAAYKVPDEVVFADELPVTSALQKVQHFKLREQARQEAEGS
ncbi:MAG: AMP-binding protein [Chloroflexi bacterium]|nr:AMP-binding protein [Chloroflexota bacterium]